MNRESISGLKIKIKGELVKLIHEKPLMPQRSEIEKQIAELLRRRGGGVEGNVFVFGQEARDAIIIIETTSPKSDPHSWSGNGIMLDLSNDELRNIKQNAIVFPFR